MRDKKKAHAQKTLSKKRKNLFSKRKSEKQFFCEGKRKKKKRIGWCDKHFCDGKP